MATVEALRRENAELRAALAKTGVTFISAGEVLCNEEGCLTRVGDTASDITASDDAHLTEKASIFLVQKIIDRVLTARPPQAE